MISGSEFVDGEDFDDSEEKRILNCLNHQNIRFTSGRKNKNSTSFDFLLSLVLSELSPSSRLLLSRLIILIMQKMLIHLSQTITGKLIMTRQFSLKLIKILKITNLVLDFLNCSLSGLLLLDLEPEELDLFRLLERLFLSLSRSLSLSLERGLSFLLFSKLLLRDLCLR